MTALNPQWPTHEQRLARIEAAQQVQNVMSRYAYYHVANMHDRCFEISAVNTPGVRADMPFGVYEGKDGLERLYLGLLGLSDREPAGKMHMHTMTTPVIEVAGDLQTAKGVWISPGHATDRRGNGEFTAAWRWVKYGCDFVPEEGQWKIWHLHIYGIFATPYDTSWVESQPGPGGGGPPPPPPEYRPDRASAPLWQYREDAIVPNAPAPPEPYETFDEATAY